MGCVFFLNPGFSQPCLHGLRLHVGRRQVLISDVGKREPGQQDGELLAELLVARPLQHNRRIVAMIINREEY
jgi:hypothetical protein